MIEEHNATTEIERMHQPGIDPHAAYETYDDFLAAKKAGDPFAHVAFFGDAQRTFKITATLIPELERATGCGVGSLVNHVVARTMNHSMMVETIRLALIGGGEKPERAKQLCDTYLPTMPLAEVHLLAVEILTALWMGKSDD
jgi:hypothetical protein